MSSRVGTAALLSWLVLVAACGSSPANHDIALKNYDRSCASVADCVAVYVGPVGCCNLPCPNEAIRTSAADKLSADLDQAKNATCMGLQPPCPSPPMCLAGRVACAAGVCALELPQTDAASP